MYFIFNDLTSILLDKDNIPLSELFDRASDIVYVLSVGLKLLFSYISYLSLNLDFFNDL